MRFLIPVPLGGVSVRYSEIANERYCVPRRPTCVLFNEDERKVIIDLLIYIDKLSFKIVTLNTKSYQYYTQILCY